MERRTFVGGVVTAPLALCSGLSFFATDAAAQLFFPTLAGFGLGAMKQNGRPATGVRPLLLVLAQYSNHPAFNTFHPVEYYERLGFGNPTPPFSTANPVNPASLREYFKENSYGRFSFGRLGLIGPIDVGVLGNDPGPERRAANILQRAAALRPQLFASAEKNSDGRVSFDELCVVIVENIPGLLPANRDNTPFNFEFRTMVSDQTITVQVHVAFAGPKTPFFQIAHELSHSLGTRDMYNTGNGNSMLSLMSAYSFDSDDQGTVHLDIWHKLALGWAEPRIFPMQPGSSATVREGADGGLILWDKSREGREFFMIERRRSNAPGYRYDANFPRDGVLIWRIQPGVDNGIVHLGAPDLAPGGAGVWTAGKQTPMLKWANGDSTGIRVEIAAPGDGTLTVAWGNASNQQSRSRHSKLFHGGTGTTPVDSGLPLTGVFYGVTTDGHLDWNRYDGSGQPVGASCGVRCWHSNTGNLIGVGWGQALHVVGCGDGVILAVNPNGLLHWYRYDGNGETDATGSRGWHRNSGNAIGRGWENVERIFVKPRVGRSTSRLAVYAVEKNGDLRWFSYEGDGTLDPAASRFWHPNSGNVIGNGWQNLRHVHGSGGVIFAIEQNGDLRWFSYEGDGASDRQASRNWHRNTGNVIGNGWQNFRHVFGGVTDVGGFAHIIFAVSDNGDLFWYRYSGQGEQDRAASRGWDPRSGTKIGTLW